MILLIFPMSDLEELMSLYIYIYTHTHENKDEIRVVKE